MPVADSRSSASPGRSKSPRSAIVEGMRETAEASADLGVREIVDHYERLVRDLDQPPGFAATADGRRR